MFYHFYRYVHMYALYIHASYMFLRITCLYTRLIQPNQSNGGHAAGLNP